MARSDPSALVIDASAALEALVGRFPDPLRLRLIVSDEIHAPHVIELGLLHALKGLARSGKLSIDRATDAAAAASRLPLIRYSHSPLASRIWSLRDNLSAYDAAYVSLAERLEVPLVSCDRSLAATTPHHNAQIELYPISDQRQ